MWKLQPAVVPFDLTNEEENRYERPACALRTLEVICRARLNAAFRCRQDKFGNVWHGRKEDLGGRKVLDVIDAEWGSRKRCLVKRTSRTYVYCRCSEGCPMALPKRKSILST